ncbi:GntR family transcriptional regulator [Ethanoligenens harbinense]|uniref:GntR family transcriptional regulator n=1 Tax=Ethanoligenens harbinense TaxID=253239 RepID=UPI000D12F8B0|nr:GntR family transcriptional regulator [Ethanoligenens harbinense YUAN-3]AYF37975.1 GntR family transcriptional regulator [Ethanoligenens harbinense]AYF40721.1 GntR family transcriptional regulator [Ethanoligenens harbinense]QCN91554.1 GntR family transcriptional regulator [Ethanoligenens harbinense]
MGLDVEFRASEPIYTQIMDEIKRQIVSGERGPGDKVEPVRDLARMLGVNPNTVQRAFSELEREGLMYTERTSGRYITADRERVSRVREQSLMQTVADFVGRMRQSGLMDTDIVGLVQQYMDGGATNGSDYGG